MQKYFAAATIILMVALVITRVLILKKAGVKAVQFGKFDKTDFLLPPFALFYFYLVFANAFDLPSIGWQELFHLEIAAWIGAVFFVAAPVLFIWALVSFGKSFRIGIDDKAPGGLVTTGAFAISRNPIYVSFAFVLLGQFLVFSSWLLLVFLVAAVWLFHRQVLREEEFLKSHYGEEFAQYCKRVRRYL